jgi:hypothetical protein
LHLMFYQMEKKEFCLNKICGFCEVRWTFKI